MATTVTTEYFHTGDGSTRNYSVDFPYFKEADVKVTLDHVLTTAYTFQNATTLRFTTAPANGVAIRIYRDTDVDAARYVLAAGSAVKAGELNENYDQLLYADQEKVDESALSDEAVTGVKIRDGAVSTGKVQNDAITEPKLAAGSVSNRQITDNSIDGAKLTDGTLDVDKIKGLDIVTTAEQNLGTPSWTGVDDTLASIGALERRHDVLYQNTYPTGTDWAVGKIWYAHGNDQTLSIWSGNNWIGISSGGTFISQPTVIWVDQANGDDLNDGHRIIDAMKTIKAAVASADHGDIILIAPGVYRETAPIDITVNNLSVVGQSLRSVFVHPTPQTETNTLFRVNSGTLLSNMTFGGIQASGARGGHIYDNDSTYGLPATQGWVAEFYPNAVIYKSPYIQNCTNFADSGIKNHTLAEYNADNNLGGYFDPNNVNQGAFGGDLTSGPTGGGIYIDGFAVSSNSPLRSMVVDAFTQVTLDGPGLLAVNNAYAQLVSFFGTFCHYHAKALNGAQLNLSNCTTDYGRYGLIADGKSPTPNFTASVSANAASGATTFTISAPTAGSNWYGSATRPQDNMLVNINAHVYPVASAVANGSGWDVTIENPDPHANATNLGLNAAISSGDTASFYNRSYISTGGHTFEYVGAGTDYRAAPENGGVPVEANQVINLNSGKVWQSSTDHNGKFKVGDTFTVNQRTGQVSISLDAYRPELINDLTPQLGGDLDVNGKNITGTVKLNGLTYPSSDGGANHVIATNGSGTLSFQSVSSLQGSGITSVVDDTTPQLGGDLDINGKDLVTTSNGDIDLDPNGSGAVVFKGNATKGSGQFKLNCENNSHGITIKGPPHSAAASYTLTLPNNVGTANQVLTTDGSGNLSFADGGSSTAATIDGGNFTSGSSLVSTSTTFDGGSFD